MGELPLLLANLYETDQNIRGILDDVGIENAHVAFAGSAMEMWQSALNHARKVGKVAAIVEAACQDYPGQADDLRQALQRYLSRRQPSTNPATDKQISREIQSLPRIYQKSSVEFLQKLKEITTKIATMQQADSAWSSDVVLEELEQVKQELIEAPFAAFIELLDIYPQGKERFVEHTAGSPAKISRSLTWVIVDSDLDDQHKQMALDMAHATAAQADYTFLFEYLKHLYWSAFLQACPSLAFGQHGQTLPVAQQIPQRSLQILAADKAEEDRFLFPPALKSPTVAEALPWNRRPPRLRPRWYHDLLDDRNTLIVGDKGSGKTAAALVTAYDLLTGKFIEPKAVLPVYWPCEPHLTTPSQQIRDFARCLARTLISYLAATPEIYLASPIQRQSAIAYLLALCFGTGNALRVECNQRRLRDTPIPARFFAKIEEQIANIEAAHLNLDVVDLERLLQIISNACPQAIQMRICLLDLQLSVPANDSIWRDYRPAFLETVRRLNRTGFIIKAFLPFAPDKEAERWFNHRISPTWSTTELRDLLEKRLLEIDDTTDGDLRMLCDLTLQESGEVMQRILAASRGLPGSLLTIGGQMAKQFVAQAERLTLQEIDELLSHVDDFTR